MLSFENKQVYLKKKKIFEIIRSYFAAIVHNHLYFGGIECYISQSSKYCPFKMQFGFLV